MREISQREKNEKLYIKIFKQFENEINPNNGESYEIEDDFYANRKASFSINKTHAYFNEKTQQNIALTCNINLKSLTVINLKRKVKFIARKEGIDIDGQPFKGEIREHYLDNKAARELAYFLLQITKE